MHKDKSELLQLSNIGPAMVCDLHLCGVYTIADLKDKDPTCLYETLCLLTEKRHDPCVWDVFAAAIHEAKTGEKTRWWAWTPERKRTLPNL